MIKQLLNIIPAIYFGLFGSNAQCNNLNNPAEQLTGIEQILNMDVSFNTINKNISNNSNEIAKQKNHIEHFYHYFLGNNCGNLPMILSYGHPNVLNSIKTILTIDKVKKYIQSDKVADIESNINELNKQFYETDYYGEFSNTQDSKQQFKTEYCKYINGTLLKYFDEINHFKIERNKFNNRNIWGYNNEARNISNMISNCFSEREKIINQQKTLAINNWENVFNKILQKQKKYK